MSDEWSKDFYKMGDDLKACVIESVTEVLNKQTERVVSGLNVDTPERTGSLKQSIIKEPAKNKSKIGWVVRYDGYNAKGQAYEKIAYALNRGFFNPQGAWVPGTHFIDRAVSLLKGTDELINEEWSKRINERSK